MSRNSLIILNDTSSNENMTGSKFKGAGWYGSSQGNHTVAIYLNDFIGRVSIQASLTTDPTDNDWFNLDLDNTGNGYIEYPDQESGIKIFNFKGNYIWIRAIMDRSYLDPMPPAVGNIQKILLNY